MDARLKEARNYVRGIITHKDFGNLVSSLFLTSVEQDVAIRIYKRNESQTFIADNIGYSVQYVKIANKRFLIKVYKYLKEYEERD